MNFYANECADNGTAFHTESVPFTVEREIITEVEIEGFTAPVNGENPFYAVTAPEGANYSIGETNWYCADGLVEPGTPFVFGNTYWMEIELIPNYGYKFGDELIAAVNGDEALVDEAVVESPESAWVITVELEVAAAVINAVELLELELPEFGALADFEVSVPEGAGYTIESVTWFLRPEITGPGEYMPIILEPGDTFDLYRPEYYDARINIVPNEGYVFAYDVSATINGEESLVSSVSFDSHHHITVWSIEFSFEPELIETVEILDLDIPEFGALADYDLSVPEGAAYSIESVRWFYPETITIEYKVELFPGNSIVAGYGYQMLIELTPNDGFAFADEVNVTINGDESLVFGYYVYEGGSKLAVFSIDFSCGEAIDETGIEGFAEPVWGEAACYDYPVPEGANYSVAKVYWCYWDGEVVHFTEEGLIFDNEEYEYFMIVNLFADDGYYFGLECFYTVNGEEYEPFAWWSDYSYIHIDGTDGVRYREFAVGPFTVTEPELIEEVAIEGFVEPVWGEAPNYDVTVPEGANYTISEVRWIYYAADGSSFGNEMQEGELFDKEDVVYYMEVTFIPNDGYKFAAELSYTVNGGSEYEESWTVSDYDSAFLMVLQFTVTEPESKSLWGDADGDGEVTTADALLLMRYLIGSDTIDEENLELCDVNGDGKIDLMDALLIMRKAMGSIECFPVEE